MKPSKIYLPMPDRENADTSPIVLEFSVWKEEEHLDIRHYWTPDGSPSPVPTKKGVNMSFEEGRILASQLKRMYLIYDIYKEFDLMADKDMATALQEYAEEAENQDGYEVWNGRGNYETVWFDFMLYLACSDKEYAELNKRYAIEDHYHADMPHAADSFLQWCDAKGKMYRMFWRSNDIIDIEEV